MSQIKQLLEIAADSYIQGYNDAANLLGTAAKTLKRDELKDKLETKMNELIKDKKANGSTNKEVTEGN